MYLPRLLDASVTRLFAQVAAISIEGLRGVGKTTTAARLTSNIARLDDPVTAARFDADPFRSVAALDTPVVLDEWQRVPAVWDAVRRLVDNDRSPGRFILTGSSRAALGDGLHTGAGRILPVRLDPMTLSERRGEAPPVALADAVEHGIDAVLSSRSDVAGGAAASLTRVSGLPGLLDLAGDAAALALDAYLGSVLSADTEALDGVNRSVTRLGAYLAAYASVASRAADHATIYEAAGVSRRTAEDYHDVLTRIGLITDVPAWSPNRLKSLARRPKRHLADAAFARAAARGARTDPQWEGQLWEAAVATQLWAAASATMSPVQAYHLRTPGGSREVDLILESSEGRCIAIEAKSSPAVVRTDARHLEWLIDNVDEVVCGLIVHPGIDAYQLGPKIAAVPLALLA